MPQVRRNVQGATLVNAAQAAVRPPLPSEHILSSTALALLAASTQLCGQEGHKIGQHQATNNARALAR